MKPTTKAQQAATSGQKLSTCRACGGQGKIAVSKHGKTEYIRCIECGGTGLSAGYRTK
jgi:Zn ribbon nucleic-acid-binding protein